MKVLITGGTGFVGSHTVAAVLAAGHVVRLFVRSPDRIAPALAPHGLIASDCEAAIGDVTDLASLRQAMTGCEAVIHAASVYTYGPPVWRHQAFIRANVTGTAQVLRTAHEMGLDPIVHVSSSWALLQRRRATITEDSEPDSPPDIYPRSKVQAERVARALQADGAPVVITYPAGVWGPHDPYWGETAQLAEQILRGRLPVGPDGATPFSDVREVARLHAAVLEPNRGPRRYLVPSPSPRFADMHRTIARFVGRSPSFTVVPSPLLLASLLPVHALQAVLPIRLPLTYAGPWYVTRDNTYGESRAQREFGIAPRHFDETVRDTLKWMASTGRLPTSVFGSLLS